MNLGLARERRKNGRFFDLCDLLQQYGHRKCKDPKDNIFGLLALVDRQKYPNIVPNCKLDNATVFYNATKAILEASDGESDWLYSTGYDWQEPALPSWVRKNHVKPSGFSLSDLRLNLLVLSKRLYFASKIHRANIIFPAPLELQLKGVRLDILQKGGRPISNRLQHNLTRVVPEWLEMANLQKLLSIGGFSPQESQQESFWRTMVGSLFVEQNVQSGPYTVRPYESADFSSFGEWLCWPAGSHKRPNLIIESSTWAAIYCRAFFVTKQGYMGLSPPRMEPGDEIWVLYGGKVPFILRPQSGACYYSFISDCYLDGFMHGEAIDNPGYLGNDVVLR